MAIPIEKDPNDRQNYVYKFKFFAYNFYSKVYELFRFIIIEKNNQFAQGHKY